MLNKPIPAVLLLTSVLFTDTTALSGEESGSTQQLEGARQDLTQIFERGSAASAVIPGKKLVLLERLRYLHETRRRIEEKLSQTIIKRNELSEKSQNLKNAVDYPIAFVGSLISVLTGVLLLYAGFITAGVLVPFFGLLIFGGGLSFFQIWRSERAQDEAARQYRRVDALVVETIDNERATRAVEEELSAD